MPRAANALARRGDTASEIYVRIRAALDAFHRAGVDTNVDAVDRVFERSFGETRRCEFNAAVARAATLADHTPDPELAALIVVAVLARCPHYIRRQPPRPRQRWRHPRRTLGRRAHNSARAPTLPRHLAPQTQASSDRATQSPCSPATATAAPANPRSAAVSRDSTLPLAGIQLGAWTFHFLIAHTDPSDGPDVATLPSMLVLALAVPAALLVAVSTLAARRAATVNPVRALRAE